ncbi:hypothetical protein VTO42DRAFT_5766 [Malbranchea cinnamomea]
MEAQYLQSRFSQTQAQVPMLEKRGSNPLAFLTRPSSRNSRPPSETTEIIDTDFEAELSEKESSSKSFESFGNDSSTTLSSPDEVQTPGPYESGPIELEWEDSKPVQGPTGPHLFRASIESSMTDKIDALEWYFPMSPVNLEDIRGQTSPRESHHARSTEEAKSSSSSRRSSVLRFPRQDEAVVRAWTPTQVAEWMYENGVEDMIVERFIDNDISGSVLLDLQIDDLKELDIHSFGKRHRLMSLIQALSDSLISSAEPALSPHSRKPSKANSRSGSRSREDHSSSPTSPDSDLASPISQPRRSRRHRHKHRDVISPAESASIVAIEQLIPKPHKCSKGEKCPKFQRRQRQIEQIAREFPNEFIQVSGDRVTTTLSEASKPEQFYRPRSIDEPSVVASSDVLGPAQQPGLKLTPEALNEVKPRDPQENVRQFLNFQHLNSPTAQPDQGSLEMFPPLSPPASSSPTVHMAANLKSLPRLTIPQNPVADDISSQRTITPSMGSRRMGSPTAAQEYNPYFQPMDPYRQTTPFSEMDVPVTAVAIEPLARETSQSVPPNLTYGNPYYNSLDPISRPRSARPEHRRRPSFATAMTPLEEGKPLCPINSPSDLSSSHHAAPNRGTMSSQPAAAPGKTTSPSTAKDGVTHSGYMKKRRTRLLRHEWQDAHFTLKGTVLAMHKDEHDAQRNSRALETIDVDDYAVACSSLASSSKLTAAFKRSLLKRAASLSSGSVKGLDETAFAFSLIPTTDKADKKLFSSSGKSHHFAVKSRDERINWMRELMLAKALKAKESGDELVLNGNVI